MKRRKSPRNKHRSSQRSVRPATTTKNTNPVPPQHLENLPTTYQALIDYLTGQENFNLFELRLEAIIRIEQLTGRPLICYVSQTNNLDPKVPARIDHDDLVGFGDLVQGVDGSAIDVLIVSNGGIPEAAERIVRLLRGKFETVRFIVPAHAYSAATLICLSGNEILMDNLGTLGPIDPQIGGVPARTIIRAFENIEKRLKVEGPAALSAYLPLLKNYDLHTLEICKTAQDLSEELARTFLSRYMLNCPEQDPRVVKIVDDLSNFDKNKSHARSIDRGSAREMGIIVSDIESIDGLQPLVRSLYNQYELFFNKTGFYKLYENSRGINWGRQTQQVRFLVPEAPGGGPEPTPQPGPPQPSN